MRSGRRRSCPVILWGSNQRQFYDFAVVHVRHCEIRHHDVHPLALWVRQIFILANAEHNYLLSLLPFATPSNCHQVGGTGAVSSTVASTRESVRMLQRRSTVFLARSDGGGRIDFNSQAGTGTSRSGGSFRDGIEMAARIGPRRSSVHGSNGGTRINTGGRNVEGGSGTIGDGWVSANEASVVGRLAPPRPDSLNKKNGLAAMVSSRLVQSPYFRTFPGEENRETVRNDSNAGENSDAPGTTTRHAISSGATRESTLDQDIQSAYGGLPTTDIGVEVSTGNIEKSQPSPRRAHEGPSTDVVAKQQGIDRKQRQSLEEHQAEGEDRDYTAAAKIGNILADLPLSKIKIVIGKFLEKMLTAVYSSVFK